MGNDIVLRDRTADLAKSFQSMLQAPLDYLIAALRTLQSMVRTKIRCVHCWSCCVLATSPWMSDCVIHVI